jgi:hypothetical protein
MRPEKRKEYMIKWRAEHPDKIKEYETRYTETRRKYRLKNQEKYRKYNKEYQKKNPEKFRRYAKTHGRNNSLKRKYGITAKEYDAMFAQQNGQCASCKSPQKNFKRRFHVDHNHTTGKIRGLLCVNCNHLIGLFEKNPNCFEDVKIFLKQH